MLNEMFKFVPFLAPLVMSFADEGAAGKDGEKDNGDKGKETVSKEEHDKMTAELEKAKGELEDMRMEVLSPDYLDFLNTKDKGDDAGEKDKGNIASFQLDSFAGADKRWFLGAAIHGSHVEGANAGFRHRY